ncbi:MAG: hypothetical protein LBT11_06680 [Treponema sp.]|jgi:hypothetical protein|nr:hypothetical protein [Treponema sp.]
MKGQRKSFLVCAAAGLLCTLACTLSGCAGLTELAGELLAGSAFREEILAEYRDFSGTGLRIRQVLGPEGEENLVISLDEYPTLELWATVPVVLAGLPDGREGRITISTLHFLAPNLNGWNEFDRELSGAGVFRLSPSGALFHLEGELEALDISKGRIRRNDTRVTGTEALTALRNRDARIAALVAWMHQYGGPGASVAPAAPEDFAQYWRPILFPELAGARDRSPEAAAVWTGEAAEWTFAADINWNTSYTRRVFPELLWPVRNSGNLLRDWEEAFSWIYLQYKWDSMVQSLGDPILLIKTK